MPSAQSIAQRGRWPNHILNPEHRRYLATRLPYPVIYGLVDPRTGEIRYVGKSNNPQYRLLVHMTPRELRARTKKNSWIKSLLAKNLLPVLIILQHTTDGGWEQDEQEWIAKLPNLTNGTIGGDGNHNPSAETRSKMAASQKGRASWNKGLPMPEWQKELLRKVNTGRPGYWKGKRLPDHVRVLMSNRQKGKIPWNKGGTHSTATRLKLSKTWILTTPNNREIRITNLRAYCKEHGLRDSLMVHVAHGKRPHHRRWKCREA